MEFLGNILTVDLTRRDIQVSRFDEELAKKYLAGRGFNSYQLFRHVEKGTEPLDAENLLIFSCGLLTGTQVPTSARLHVSARSPHTGFLGSSNVGAHFGAELRASGFQSILIRGRSTKPVFLWIDRGQAEIRDATDLWGQNTWETRARLWQLLKDPKVRIMGIGTAGENLVSYACIMATKGHAAGRTGMGAVMGSKNLKAIAVRGEKTRGDLSDSVKRLVRNYGEEIKEDVHYPYYSKYGNSIFVPWASDMGILCTRNYRQVQFEDAENISGKKSINYVTRPIACHRCPVHCKAEIRIEKGMFAGTEGERSDIEPVVALGSKCGVNNIEAILYLYNLCGKVGLDAITTGSVLAFAMDLYDRGILSKQDTDGIELTWGNYEAMEAMIYRIAAREGFGAILADGVREASRLIGRGAEKFAYHSKGLELPAYDPRGAMGTALGYAVSTRGGDFTSVYVIPEYRWSPEKGREEFGTEKAVDRLSIEGKGRLVKRCLIVSAILDSLGLCKVPALSILGEFDLKREAELTSALTGWQMEADELFTIGERILNVERLFNLRCGADRNEDRIPDKFIQEAVEEGPTKGMKVNLEPMVDQFYEAMGWDTDGNPTEHKLKELDLWEDVTSLQEVEKPTVREKA